MIDYYISRFDFNALHSMSDDKATAHQHTFHIAVYIGREEAENKKDVNFDIVKAENTIREFIDAYSGRYLNDVEEMKSYDADLEGLGRFFYERIGELIRSIGYEAYQLDISDNMTHTYQISDIINLPVLNSESSFDNYDVILTQKDYLNKNARG